MEVVKNLTESELDWLRSAFEEAGDSINGLAITEFAEVLKKAAAGKNIPASVLSDDSLHELFNEIDFNGDTKVSWEEFTMFIIDNAMKGKYEGDEKIRQYIPVKASRIPVGEAPNGGGFAVAAEIKKLSYFPNQNEIIKISTFGDKHKLKVINPTTLSGSKCTPKLNQRITSVERLPDSDILVTASAGMKMHFWDVSPMTAHHVNATTAPVSKEEELRLKKTVKVSDTQLCLRYCSRYHKLFSASRTGTLNYWSVDKLEIIKSQPKIHEDAVLDLLIVDQEAITASLDSTINIWNLERDVSTGVLKGHTQGVCTLAFSKPHQFLISAGFEYDPLVWVLHIKDFHPWRLIDKQQPHHGTILGLFTVPDSPQVITADSEGMVKVWDLRTFQAVQTILPWQHWSNQYHARSNLFSAVTYVESTASIILSGPRSTFVYEYQQTNNHDCADNTPVITSYYNAITRSIITVHKKGIKVWDEMTGHIESVFDDLVSDEVTAFTVCNRGRKFFLGTMGGNVLGFVTSTGMCVQEFSAHKGSVNGLVYGVGSRGCKFVVSLSTSGNSGVIIHSDSSEMSNIPSTATNIALQDCPPTTACITAVNSLLIIGTTTGRLVCVDTQTFAITHVIESLHTELPRSLREALYPRSVQEEDAGCEGEIAAVEVLGTYPAFACGDSTGHVYVYCFRPYFFPQRLVCRWKHDVADETRAANPQGAHGMRRQSTRSEALTCTALAFHQSKRTLYVGDDHGFVTVYHLDAAFDASGLSTTKFPASNEGVFRQPRRYKTATSVHRSNSWRAHSDEVNNVDVVVDMSRVTIFTTGYDLKVHVWSTDGIMIGSLCQGRQREKNVLYSREKEKDDKDAAPAKGACPPWEFKTAPTMIDDNRTNGLKRAKQVSERLKGGLSAGDDEDHQESTEPKATTAFVTQPMSPPATPKPDKNSEQNKRESVEENPFGTLRSPTHSRRKIKMPASSLEHSFDGQVVKLPDVPRIKIPERPAASDSAKTDRPKRDRPLPEPPVLFKKLESTKREFRSSAATARRTSPQSPPIDFHRGVGGGGAPSCFAGGVGSHPSQDASAFFPYHGAPHPHVLDSQPIAHSAYQRILYWADYRTAHGGPAPPVVQEYRQPPKRHRF